MDNPEPPESNAQKFVITIDKETWTISKDELLRIPILAQTFFNMTRDVEYSTDKKSAHITLTMFNPKAMNLVVQAARGTVVHSDIQDCIGNDTNQLKEIFNTFGMEVPNCLSSLTQTNVRSNIYLYADFESRDNRYSFVCPGCERRMSYTRANKVTLNSNVPQFDYFRAHLLMAHHTQVMPVEILKDLDSQPQSNLEEFIIRCRIIQ